MMIIQFRKLVGRTSLWTLSMDFEWRWVEARVDRRSNNLAAPSSTPAAACCASSGWPANEDPEIFGLELSFRCKNTFILRDFAISRIVYIINKIIYISGILEIISIDF